MKKSHFLIAASALLLASCGGGSNNNQAQNNASTPESNDNGNASEQTSAPKNADGQVVLSGSIDNNVTWKDLGLPVDYIVEGEIQLNGNSLVTVEPGVTIMFTGTDGGIFVGENAGLKMQGTKDKPIVLTSPTNNQNPGSWGGVTIRSKRADNILEYVTFQNGGAGEYVLAIDGSASIKNCTIDGTSDNGALLLKTTAFENNTFKNCKNFPVVYNSWTENTTYGGKGNVFVNNGKNFISIRPNYSEDNKTYTFVKESVPFFCNEGLEFNGRITVNIEPGARFAINRGERIYVGPEVIFKANGTAADPIVFAGSEDKPGYWNGVEIQTTQNDESSITYCNFENLGNKDFFDDCAFYIGGDAGFKFNNCNISKTKAKYGVRIDNAGNYIDNGMATSSAINISDVSAAKIIVNSGTQDEHIAEGATFDDIAKIK